MGNSAIPSSNKEPSLFGNFVCPGAEHTSQLKTDNEKNEKRLLES